MEPALVVQLGDVDIRPVYVIEEDAEVLWNTLATRASGPRFLALTEKQQQGVVGMNRLYNQWLRAVADRHGQPWLFSKPWDTLAARIHDIWSSGNSTEET